jgi:hypothetical protein
MALVSVGPGLVVPTLHQIIIPVPFKLPVRYRTFEFHLLVIHADHFPIAMARPALHENLLAHLKGKSPENPLISREQIMVSTPALFFQPVDQPFHQE